MRNELFATIYSTRSIVMGKGDDRFHVGMGIIGEDGLRREAQLLGLPWPLV